VQFENGNIIKNKRYGHVVRGSVKNPYYRSVFNIGFIGVGVYNIKIHKAYPIWRSMLDRGYGSKFKIKHPTYKIVSVCEEWHNFQNFAKWFDDNNINNFELDKDILFKGNKTYSPETCCFVPHNINSLIVKSDSIRGIYPIGVSKKRSRFKAQIKINSRQIPLGTFDTPQEAFQAYKTAKEAYIKEVADKWKPLIADNVYQALINYKVEITD
jgi:hypothetical protein